MRYTPLICGLLLISPPIVMAEDVDVGDTPATAKTIRVRATETLISPQDVDFYTFVVRSSREPHVDNSGNVSVAFSQKSPPGSNPQSGWKIELFSEGDLANSLYTTTLPETSLKAEFEQGLSVGTYYYKISSLDGAIHPAVEYTLSSSWETNDHYEKSPNDTPDSATPIRANEIYSGNLSSATDVDYFHFNLEVPDTVTIMLNQNVPDVHSNGGWQFGLLSQTGAVINMPSSSQASTPLQVELGAGVHYLFVKSIPTENLQTVPVGRAYQIKVTAATVAAPESDEVCPFVFTYAQNPVTQHWATFPTPCDVPTGWLISQTEVPNSAKVCPSRNSTYKFPYEKDGVITQGKLTIPYVEVKDADGGEYLFRIELNQEGEVTTTATAADFKFNVGDLRLLRVLEKPNIKLPDNVDLSVAIP
ncbi:MAG: hypothetical protein KAG43_04620 [Candidatus Marithrix sp.]|nr:hypothetical protein [Candidatus Marithrix sp.]